MNALHYIFTIIPPSSFGERAQGRLRKVSALAYFNPQKRPSRAFIGNVDLMRQVRRGVVENSLFPEKLTDSTGTFHKPPDW